MPINNEPGEKQFEADCRDDQEVHGGNHVPMVSKKRSPSLALFVAPVAFRKVARDGRQADGESQLLKLGLDSLRTPRILNGETADQIAKFRGDGRPSGSPFLDGPPVASKALLMPSDHGFGLDNDETGSPFREA